MRVAIIGAGGVGGQIAARLGAGGHEVSILARGAHLAAMRERGLRLVTPKDEVAMQPVVATGSGAELPESDLIVVAVKGQDLDDAMEQMAPSAARGGLILPFLNGVEATDRLAARFGADRVLLGIARISAHIEAPGVIRQVSEFASYVIGRADGSQDDPQVAEIRASFARAGIEVPEAPDVRVELWKKFVMLSAFSAVTAGARCDAGVMKRSEALLGLYRAVAQEAAALARAEGVALPEGFAEKAVEYARGLPDAMRASLAHDLASGKRLEIDWLAGAIPRLGARHGLSAPHASTVAALLEPWKNGQPAAG